MHLGRSFPTASSDPPEPSADHAIGFLFGLASGGVCLAANVTARAVRSYRTLSPLPPRGRRFAFCCTIRGLTPPRRYLAPCPMKPGLSSTSMRTQRLPDRLSARILTRISHGLHIASSFMLMHRPTQPRRPFQLAPADFVETVVMYP